MYKIVPSGCNECGSNQHVIKPMFGKVVNECYVFVETDLKKCRFYSVVHGHKMYLFICICSVLGHCLFQVLIMNLPPLAKTTCIPDKILVWKHDSTCLYRAAGQIRLRSFQVNLL